MSYILEALKKSQRDRELGQVPGLATETATETLEHGSAMNPWIIGSVIMALLALVVALWSVFGRQPSTPEIPRITAQEPVPEQPAPVAAEISKVQDPEEASSAHEPPPQAKAIIKPAPEAEVAPEQASPVAAAEKKTDKPATVKKSPVASSGDKPADRQSELERIRREYARMQAEEKQLARKQEPSKPRKEAPTVPAPAGLSTTSPTAPVTTEYPSIHELPADVLTRMPPRNIILQSYSNNPEQRFVILNSVKLHQGQGTANGLQVLEIRVDGLVLEFEGYQFFQPR